MKVVISGPESTGKSTLSKAVAEHYKTAYVPEYSRTYLKNSDGKYAEEDLVAIAKGQIENEDRAFTEPGNLVICDTSLEVIKIWSEWKFGGCDAFIEQQASLRTPDLFLLLKPDIPWEPDPLRENPEDRDELFAYYQKSLTKYSCPVIEISGDPLTRISQAIAAIDSLILGN